MTDERIEKIKSAVEAADHIPAEKKAELLEILANLKPVIAKVAETHPTSITKGLLNNLPLRARGT